MFDKKKKIILFFTIFSFGIKQTAFITKGEAKEKIEKELIEGLEKIDGAIKEKSSLFNNAAGGESIGFLGIVFAVIGYWLPMYEEAGSVQTRTQKFPAIAEWTTKFVNHPAVKENLPSTDKLLPFFRQVHEFVSSASNNQLIKLVLSYLILIILGLKLS